MAKMKSFEYSIYLLSRREYSEKEIRDKLIKIECTRDEIEQTINELKQYKYLSDERFVRSFFHIKNNKFGNSYLINELKSKHKVDSNIIEDSISELPDEIERIKEIINKKYYKKDLTSIEVKNKIIRYLISKGFKYNNIKIALE